VAITVDVRTACPVEKGRMAGSYSEYKSVRMRIAPPRVAGIVDEFRGSERIGRHVHGLVS
jgi:hypothetical protein